MRELSVQTAYGSLTTGLDLSPEQILLIRGGTSSVGLTAATLARQMGAKVIATTRQHSRLAALAAHGVDYPLLDDGAIATAVREIAPNGVDATLELVGTSTLRVAPRDPHAWNSLLHRHGIERMDDS